MEQKEAKQVMDYKGAQIKKAMDVKNEAIFISSSARDASLMVTTYIQAGLFVPENEKETEKKWQYWQKFFYDQMTGQMPIEPECSTCGAKLKLSQKGDWYCPEYYNPKNPKHHPPQTLTPNEEKFNQSLK